MSFPPPQSPIYKTQIIPGGCQEEPRTHPQFDILRWGDGRAAAKDDGSFVIGQVRYADVFGNQYLSGFCFFYNTVARIFYASGGAGHNYRRKLNEEETKIAEERDALPQIGQG